MNLSLAVFYFIHFSSPLKFIFNTTFKITVWRHKLCYLLTPNFDFILNYNCIFHIPTAYHYKQHSTKHPKLYYCYFTSLTHLFLDIFYSYTLPLTPIELPRYDTGAPPGTIPKTFPSSHTVPSKGLTTIKTATEDTSTILTMQLYTSIYVLRSSTPHMPYIPIYYPTPIMTHGHAPTDSSQKWLQSIVLLYWR